MSEKAKGSELMETSKDLDTRECSRQVVFSSVLDYFCGGNASGKRPNVSTYGLGQVQDGCGFIARMDNLVVK